MRTYGQQNCLVPISQLQALLELHLHAQTQQQLQSVLMHSPQLWICYNPINSQCCNDLLRAPLRPVPEEEKWAAVPRHREGGEMEFHRQPRKVWLLPARCDIWWRLYSIRGWWCGGNWGRVLGRVYFPSGCAWFELREPSLVANPVLYSVCSFATFPFLLHFLRTQLDINFPNPPLLQVTNEFIGRGCNYIVSKLALTHLWYRSRWISFSMGIESFDDSSRVALWTRGGKKMADQMRKCKKSALRRDSYNRRISIPWIEKTVLFANRGWGFQRQPH